MAVFGAPIKNKVPRFLKKLEAAFYRCGFFFIFFVLLLGQMQNSTPIYGMDLDIRYLYNAELIRVIDGDTVDAWIDLGFDITIRRRIRLWGIDAPETRTLDLREKAEGIEVKERLIEILTLNRGYFAVRSVGLDKYGRCLGEIYIRDVNINKQLLAEGIVDVYRK